MIGFGSNHKNDPLTAWQIVMIHKYGNGELCYTIPLWKLPHQREIALSKQENEESLDLVSSSFNWLLLENIVLDDNNLSCYPASFDHRSSLIDKSCKSKFISGKKRSQPSIIIRIIIDWSTLGTYLSNQQLDKIMFDDGSNLRYRPTLTCAIKVVMQMSIANAFQVLRK